MKNLICHSLSGFIALTVINAAQSQISYDGTALSYSQNFDSLGTSSTWANDSTLPGWYLEASSSTFGSSGVPTSLNVADVGGESTAAAYNIGTNGVNSATDRALGWVVSSATGTAYTGLQLQNNSGSDYDGVVTISYSIEQYSAKNTVSESITSGYKLLVSSGNQVASSGFTTLDTIANPNLTGSPSAIDGNAPGNFVTVTDNIDLSSTPWTSGEYLWFRIADPREASGNNELLAIDDVSVDIAAQAVPEPSALAMTALGLAGMFLLIRRRTARG